MSSRAAVAGMILLLLSASELASAKCGFWVPCRSLRVTVLNCAADIEMTKARRKFIEELAGSEVSSNMGRYRESAIEYFLKHPYSFTVTAKVTQASADRCEGQYLPLPERADPFLYADSLRANIGDSIGKRILSYEGHAINECQKLLNATEIRVRMAESWCETSDHKNWRASNIPLASIKSITRSK
jgi:hypothetical protein